MLKIKRICSSKQRFFEIVESMPNPICNLITVNNITSGTANNKDGVCVYEYTPTKYILPEFEKQIKKYIFKQ